MITSTIQPVISQGSDQRFFGVDIFLGLAPLAQ